MEHSDQSDTSPRVLIQEYAELTQTGKPYPFSTPGVTTEDTLVLSADVIHDIHDNIEVFNRKDILHVKQADNLVGSTSRPHGESNDSGESTTMEVSFLLSPSFVC